MKFKDFLETRINGFDGYARNKSRARGMSRKITIKSIIGNPRLNIPQVGDSETSPETKKRNDKMRHVLKGGKFSKTKDYSIYNGAKKSFQVVINGIMQRMKN
jgi:hypothetical protein